MVLDLFFNRKPHGLSPWAIHSTRKAGPRLHHGLYSGRQPRLTIARPSGRSGSRQPTVVGRKWRGRRGAAGERLTGAWTAVWRWHSGGGALARVGDGPGVMRTKRRRVRGVGICAFYWAESRRGRPGCLHGWY
jgi:hypothetical protein